MSKKRRSDYQVGYKNPPRATQFKPGQSGNPNGRPKGKAMTFAESIEKELQATIIANEGGTPRRMSKLQAIAKQQTNKALRGDHKATELLIRAVEPRAFEQIDNLSPVLREMRAIHERHRSTDRSGEQAANDSNRVEDAEE